MRRHVVERHGVARAAAAALFRRIERRDLRRRSGQRLRRQQIAAAAAGPLDVGRAPDLRRPVGRGGRARRDRHAGSPAWRGRPARSRTLPRGAIAGGSSGRECAWRPVRRRAPHRRRRCGRSSRRRAGAAPVIASTGRLEHGGEVLAQRMHALAVRAHRQVPVAELGQRAGRRHRGVRDVGPRDGHLDRRFGRRRGRGPGADAPIVAGLAFSQAASCWRRPRGGATLSHLACAGAAAAAAWATLSIGLTKRHEVGFADDLQLTLRGTANRRLVERRQGWRRGWAGAACGRAGHPWAGRRGREPHRAQLRRQVEARHALPDNAIGRGRASPARRRSPPG